MNQLRASQAQQGSLEAFVDLIRGTDYEWSWHHSELASKLMAWIRGDITRLMVSMPPRHGKSELVSRLLPAFIFGLHPAAKIIACSYSASLASDMNSDVQRIMTSEEYGLAFPGSCLNPKNVVTLTAPKRNSTRFDIVGNDGYYICAGVNGPITGKGFHFGIIDDPIKNQQEAESKIQRDKIFGWYQSTFYSRKENHPRIGKARILITQTRWHEDDLAGRLLEMQDQEDADQWETVIFPAIAEEDEPRRSRGEALWPTKYDLDDLATIKAQLGSRSWAALYQQRPSAVKGNIFKRSWFQHFTEAPRGTVNFYLDTAYTKDSQNDSTAIIAYIKHQGRLYITHCDSVRLEFPELCRFIPAYCKEHGYTGASRIWIEPKASGLSVYQQLKQETRLNLIKDKPPKDSKEARANMVTAKIEAGQVLLPEFGSWVDDFLEEVCAFPTAKHDDRVDCLVGAINTTYRPKAIRMTGRTM